MIMDLPSFFLLISDLVSIHIDTINEVYKETKTLAPTQKVSHVCVKLIISVFDRNDRTDCVYGLGITSS